MPAIDQYRRVVFELAEQRRQNAQQSRMGKVHQVWSQNGETKVRIELGTKPDGTPWLSPWLHTENQRGSHREEHKYTKGQNVLVGNIGGDYRQASITPYAETQQSQRPNHATDNEMSEQYDTLREQHGHDFHEHWLAAQSQQSQQSQQAGQTDSQNMQPEQKDDSSKSIVIIRMGAPPQQQQDKGQPWDGPSPTGGKPKSRLLIYCKGTSGQQVPTSADEIHIEYGNGNKMVVNEDGMLHKHTKQITHQVGNSSITITPSGIFHKSDNIVTDGPTYLDRGQKPVMIKSTADSTRVYASGGEPDPLLQTPIGAGNPPAQPALPASLSGEGTPTS